MKKKFIASIAVGTVLLGTFIPATIALAADANVQALLGQSSISVNGKSVASQVPKLVYGGTTYVQLYSVEQALKGAGITPSWDGQTFNFDMPSSSTTGSSGSSGGTSASVISFNNLSESVSGAGSTIVNGNAVNSDSVPHSFTITATFYDANGNVIGEEVGSVNDLPAGQSASFQTLPTGDYMDAASYKVQVQDLM